MSASKASGPAPPPAKGWKGQKEHVRCNLCGADDTGPVFTERGFSIVRCRRCGLVYVNPRLTEEARSDLYGMLETPEGGVVRLQKRWGEYLESVTGERVVPERRLPSYDFDLKIHLRYHRCLSMLRRLTGKGGGDLLDIGCSVCRWLWFARYYGWEARGYDIVEPPKNWWNACLRERVRVADSLSGAGFREGEFDAVTMWDVIEHVSDPKKTLEEVRRLLRPGGVLFLRTPNASWQVFKSRVLSLLFRKDRYLRSPVLSKYGFFLPEEHLYAFSLPVLRRYLEGAGFRVCRVVVENPEEKRSRLTELAYAVVTLQARALNALTRGRHSSHIGLMVYARKV